MWRTRLHISIRWDWPDPSPAGVKVVERAVDTPAQLRHLVDRARADPHVVAFPYRLVRELVGDEPTHCRGGHAYAGRIRHPAGARLVALLLRRAPRAALPPLPRRAGGPAGRRGLRHEGAGHVSVTRPGWSAWRTSLASLVRSAD